MGIRTTEVKKGSTVLGGNGEGKGRGARARVGWTSCSKTKHEGGTHGQCELKNSVEEEKKIYEDIQMRNKGLRVGLGLYAHAIAIDHGKHNVAGCRQQDDREDEGDRG